jgi:hypothetical protein
MMSAPLGRISEASQRAAELMFWSHFQPANPKQARIKPPRHSRLPEVFSEIKRQIDMADGAEPPSVVSETESLKLQESRRRSWRLKERSPPISSPTTNALDIQRHPKRRKMIPPKTRDYEIATVSSVPQASTNSFICSPPPHNRHEPTTLKVPRRKQLQSLKKRSGQDEEFVVEPCDFIVLTSIDGTKESHPVYNDLAIFTVGGLIFSRDQIECPAPSCDNDCESVDEDLEHAHNKCVTAIHLASNRINSREYVTARLRNMLKAGWLSFCFA